MEDNVENMIFCQSCGMPLSKDEDFGSNVNGAKNEEIMIEKLAYSLGRNDEEPHIELAKELDKTKIKKV
jgi:hypothetical protein